MSDVFAALLADVTEVTATVETDIGSIVNHYAVIKGIAEVALTALSATDPPAAAIITAGIGTIDGWIDQGSDAVAANAAAIIATTQAILATAAPAVSVVTSAATAITS